MRPLALLPLILVGCVQPSAVRQDVAAVRIMPLLAANPGNCGTPYRFKPCGIIWRPSHRPPIYAEQLENIVGNIPVSDMPTVIAKDPDAGVRQANAFSALSKGY